MKKVLLLITVIVVICLTFCSCSVNANKKVDNAYVVMEASTYRVSVVAPTEAGVIVSKQYVLYSDGKLEYTETYSNDEKSTKTVELSNEEYRQVASVLNDLWSIPNRDNADVDGGGEGWLIQTFNKNKFMLSQYRGHISHDSLHRLFNIFEGAFAVKMDTPEEKDSAVVAELHYLYGDGVNDAVQMEWTIRSDSTVECMKVVFNADGTQEYIDLEDCVLDKETFQQLGYVLTAKENSVAESGSAFLSVTYYPLGREPVAYSGYIDASVELLQLCDTLKSLYAE